jgi:N-acetylglutamate synthase-like GNAT family acetyltransferase
MTLQYRPYRASDRGACIAIFRTNVPRFFRDHELEDFADFIDSSGCEYFVVLAGGEIAGCGGFGLRDGGDAADLCWGMVHREQQGKRIGAYLLLARLRAVATTTEAKYVRLRTSQHTEGFFRRYGFEIQSSKPDGIALGLDDVEMKLDLTDANRASIERYWREMVG